MHWRCPREPGEIPRAPCALYGQYDRSSPGCHPHRPWAPGGAAV